MSSPGPQDPNDEGAIINNTERHDTPLLDGITEFLNEAAKEPGATNNVEGDGMMDGNENDNNTQGFGTQHNDNNEHGFGTQPNNNDNDTQNQHDNGEASGTQNNNAAPTNNAATETGAPVAQAIQIRITSSDNETTFRIKTNTKMGRVMTAYAEKAGKSKATMRFLYEGTRITDVDTPETLEMDDGDAIEVHQEQTGGGCDGGI